MSTESKPSRKSNLRVAWALASVAAVFFAGVILAHSVGAGGRGLDVLGIVVVVFLVIAIGRNLWGRR